jgi:hypothetical protein
MLYAGERAALDRGWAWLSCGVGVHSPVCAPYLIAPLLQPRVIAEQAETIARSLTAGATDAASMAGAAAQTGAAGAAVTTTVLPDASLTEARQRATRLHAAAENLMHEEFSGSVDWTQIVRSRAPTDEKSGKHKKGGSAFKSFDFREVHTAIINVPVFPNNAHRSRRSTHRTRRAPRVSVSSHRPPQQQPQLICPLTHAIIGALHYRRRRRQRPV